MLRIVAPAKLIQRVEPSLEVPSGVSDMVVPRGTGWMWLMLLARIGGGIIAHSAYPRRVESVSGLADLDAEPVVRGQCDGRWAALWLALIEDRMSSRFFRDPQDAPPNLNIRHPRDVRNEIRMTGLRLRPSQSDCGARLSLRAQPG